MSYQNDFDFLSEKTDIVSIITHYTGAAMKKVGSDTYRLNPCPLPGCTANDAFSVSPKKGTYHCFSCNRSGNLFHFVKEVKRLGDNWGEVIKEVAQICGIAPSQLPGSQNGRANGAPPKPKDPAIETRKEIFTAAAQWYHQNLLDTPKALEILQKERKYSREFLEKDFPLIGYTGNSRGGLLKALRERWNDEQLLASGLISKSDKDGSIYEQFGPQYFVFFHLVNGQVCDFSLKDAFKKTRKEKRVDYRLHSEFRIGNCFAFNQDDLHQDEIIFVEGQNDVAQIKRVMPNIGVVADKNFTNDDIYRKLLKNKKMVYLWFDPDKQGDIYTRKVFDKFWGDFPLMVIPAEAGEGDPDEYLRSCPDPAGRLQDKIKNSVEIFNHLIQSIFEVDDTYTNIRMLKPFTDKFSVVRDQTLVDIAIESIRRKFSNGSVSRIVSETVKKDRYTKEVSSVSSRYLPYFEKDGVYFRQTLKGEFNISNFTLKIDNIVLFNDEVRYICTLRNYKGQVAEGVEFTPIQRVDKRKFYERIAGCGNGHYHFGGSPIDLSGMWQLEELQRDVPVTVMINHYGEVRSQNMWIFDNCVIKDGKIYRKEEGEDVILVDGNSYCSHGVRVYSNSRPELNLDHPFTQEFLQQVADAFHHMVDMQKDGTVKSYQGYLMLGIALANIYTHEISQHLSFFPELIVYGQAESGKSSALGLLNKLFGWRRDKASEPWDKATPAGTYQFLEQVSSMPLYYDEFLNNVIFEKMLGTLKAVYDRLGEGKGGLKSEGRQVSIVNGTLWLSGQDNPQDEAILSRSVFIRFGHVNAHKTKSYNFLKDNKDNLSAITRQLIIEKSPETGERLSNYIVEISDWIIDNSKGISDRVAKNHAVAAAALKIFGIELPEDFPNYLIEHCLLNMQHRYTENPVTLFFDEMLYLIGKGQLSDVVKYWALDYNIAFHFPTVIKEIQESLRRKNEKLPFKATSIKDILLESDACVDKNRLVKINDGVRRCLVFDIDKLPKNIREEIITLNQSGEEIAYI